MYLWIALTFVSSFKEIFVIRKLSFILDINAFKNPVLNLTPGYADNLALPLALLLFKTFLPLLFCILFLNP